jgi:hypothetical protein
MNNFEKGLYSRINQRIEARGYCVVHDHDLARICPPEESLRQKQMRVIEQFAAKHGLSVSIRDTGINATFKKGGKGRQTRNMPTDQTVRLKLPNGSRMQ